MSQQEIKEAFRSFTKKRPGCAEELVTVRYGETDQMGVVYHGHYLAWFNIVRDRFFERLGLYINKMEKLGIFSPVVEANCFYNFPAVYPDVLLVQCILKQPERVARIVLYYRIVRKKDGRVICLGKTVNVLMNTRGKMFLEIPREILQNLEKIYC